MKMKSFAAMFLIAGAAFAQDADTAGARVPVENYIKAHATGDAAFMRKAFHPDAKIYSFRDGKLQALTVDEFAKLFPGKPAANEAQRVRRIENVEVTGVAGTAKVYLDYPTVTYTDYISLLKVGGEWKIINKTFNGVSKPKPVSSAELEFRDQMALTDYKNIEYRDAKGSSITFAQFQEKLSDAGFSMEKNKVGEQATAIVKLQSEKPTAPKVKYKLAAGSPFPVFKLNATDGRVIDNEALRGKYTVVSFYFAECAPCIKEVPMLNEFAEQNKEFSTLAVTFDSPDEAKKFAQRTRLSWRTIAGAEELIGQIGVKNYPTFALLDPKGVLVAIESGFGVASQGATLVKWVKSAIAGRAQ